jgi:pimeloyl-ACP methyl ester carboxylesterase
MRILAVLVVCLLALSCVEVLGSDQFFERSGIKLRYCDEGDGQAVVLLHGYAEDLEAGWRKSGVFDGLLKQGYRVIAFDHRGHGKSSRPGAVKDYGLEMIHDVARLLEHLQVKRAHLVGYSMGAAVADGFLKLYPQHLLSVTLAGYGEPPLPESVTPTLISEIRNNLGRMSLLDGNDPEALARVSVGWREWMALTAPEEIDVRGLVISGRDDFFRSAAEDLAGKYPEFRLVLVDGDHGTARSQPEFLENLLRHLRSRE